MQQQKVIPQPRKSLQRPESVKSWLRELADTCEPEAMTALQNKAIRGSANFKSNLKAESVNKDVESVLSNVNAVRRIAEHAAGVLEELENVQRCIIGNKPELSGPLLQSALGGVTSFVKSNVATPSSNALLKQCDAVKVSGKPTDLEDLARIATGVRAHVEEQCLKYLEVLSDTLEEPPSSQCLSAALSGLGALCSAYGGAIGYSAVKAGLIRALLIVCVNSHTYTLRQNTNGEENQLTAPSSSLGKALRVLATLCQTEQSIRQFCQAGGVSVLQDILEDKRCAEPERREACAVLTQITGPWVTNETEINKDKNNKHQNWDWRQELNKHKTQLVRALTDLLSETKCCQTLLLCAAALANASLPRMSTFNDNTQVMSPNSVAVTESLAWCEAATELLKAVKRRGPGCSVFLQEQTSSLLCNLSAVQECRRRLCPSSKNPANSSEPIMAIFSFLNTCRRFIAPEESASFRRGVMRASERMDYSSSLLQNSVRAKSDQSRSSTKSERLPRTPDNFFTNTSSKTNLELSSFKSPESPKFTPAEKASAERMLISTTLCLTRFCRDREVARFCFKLGSQRHLLLAADLLKMQQQKNVKEVLAVCEETARIISAYGNNDTSLVTVNESYV
ncbi:uncharacterized protein LOC113378231 [Ctenocephalides felis]|uniref:uncharacterized protein LOC113378231 n=1 Tax=Ctenocephalides felis TaxID=7515 RepID=UPI000E6E1848|nr:uncharacterized protein LOC113378231 [Ctenocephalides felis]